MTDTFDAFGLDRGAVSVIGATGLVVGNVIGISIFTLPGPLAADAGPVVIFGILLAAIPLVFGIGITYQLGSAIPTTGGNYIYASRLVHPFAGFLLPWLILPGVWAGLLFIGVGFAEYVGLFVATPDLVLIYLLLTTFLILNILGIHPVARVQLLFVGVPHLEHPWHPSRCTRSVTVRWCANWEHAPLYRSRRLPYRTQ